jgi:hypothetical protein
MRDPRNGTFPWMNLPHSWLQIEVTNFGEWSPATHAIPYSRLQKSESRIGNSRFTLVGSLLAVDRRMRQGAQVKSYEPKIRSPNHLPIHINPGNCDNNLVACLNYT